MKRTCWSQTSEHKRFLMKLTSAAENGIRHLRAAPWSCLLRRGRLSSYLPGGRKSALLKTNEGSLVDLVDRRLSLVMVKHAGTDMTQGNCNARLLIPAFDELCTLLASDSEWRCAALSGDPPSALEARLISCDEEERSGSFAELRDDAQR